MKKTGEPPKTTRNFGRSAKSGTFTIGAERFAKISAVEGVVLTKQMHARIGEFEAKRMSAAERREAIVRAHRKG